MSDIKQEIIPDHEAQSDMGEEYKVRRANVAPMLTCMGCNGFFRGPVTYCKNKHGFCSTCFEDKVECPITGCAQKTSLILDFPSELVKELKLPLPCKFFKDGCDQENADEEVIADHEVECGHRKVQCFAVDCPDQPAMELEAHIFSAHNDLYGRCHDNPGKWFLLNFATTKFLGAQKIWIDLESGLRFSSFLFHNDKEKYWKCFTMVFAGKHVAKKFRAEMRLSSYDRDTSVISNCNFRCLDDWLENDASKEFCINDHQFKLYNKGHIQIGDHNKDKNGELMLPVSVEVKMKKLNVG